MNISVINLKTILFKFIKIVMFILIAFAIITVCVQTVFRNKVINLISKYNYAKILNVILLVQENNYNNLGSFIIAKQMLVSNKLNNNTETDNIGNNIITNETEQIEISKTAETQDVSEKNLSENYNSEFDGVRINNECDYDITDDMLNITVELTDKKDIFIYHTHTCESYTPSEKYNYTMTGNYRTTDNNYNVVCVGEELTQCLIKKGFNVVHNTTYHDYPSYSGSYARSLITAENSLHGTNTQIVFDIHRDAVGDGASYGPTVKINDTKVAQLMFVIGTNGGGLEHDNWNKNLKIAIEIQKKANEMYPGLFRPIIIRNSRYNQHLAVGASIIEVGATGNTLEECLLSMQYLANVLDEYL